MTLRPTRLTAGTKAAWHTIRFRHQSLAIVSGELEEGCETRFAQSTNKVVWTMHHLLKSFLNDFPGFV